jgi:hypothetical protein
MSEKRSFTIESAEIKVPLQYQGRFESKTPSGAAAKATRRLFQFLKEDNPTSKKSEIRFVLRETTQGSAKKEYHYIGIKRALETPREITRGSATITVTHEYKVKACQ